LFFNGKISFFCPIGLRVAVLFIVKNKEKLCIYEYKKIKIMNLNMKKEITYEDYSKIQILVGTVLKVSKNEKARKPSLVVEVDFGSEVGVRKSSAQITHYYNSDNLVGKQVIGVCNFPKKNIAGIVSEVLILGAIEKDGKVVLLHPSQKTENGLEIA
jgi:tRNA-binding protein